MDKYNIPEKILELIGSQKYEKDNIGQSSSEVFIFADKVLKIQNISDETKNECNMCQWLEEQQFNTIHVPVPKILTYCEENNKAYTLESRIHGKMLCEEEYITNPKLAVKLAAEGLKALWKVDIKDCPYTTSRIKERLKAARYNVEHNLVDVEDVEPETFGADGFKDPMDLLLWLEANCPEEDLVLTHGDFCLPNVMVENDRISGFIDLGKMGPADKWTDIAICYRSLKHNFEGKYGGPIVCTDFDIKILLNELGIELDEKKLRFYYLLDELF